MAYRCIPVLPPRRQDRQALYP
uniref:Uncharacterized protein n=1 Tax=Anguilla anguilla TaxID=7936 RepID=A0A0E9XAV7_ANGAN